MNCFFFSSHKLLSLCYLWVCRMFQMFSRGCSAWGEGFCVYTHIENTIFPLPSWEQSRALSACGRENPLSETVWNNKQIIWWVWSDWSAHGCDGHVQRCAQDGRTREVFMCANQHPCLCVLWRVWRCVPEMCLCECFHALFSLLTRWALKAVLSVCQCAANCILSLINQEFCSKKKEKKSQNWKCFLQNTYKSKT